MLGKLLKHELKYELKLYSIMYIILVVVAALAGIAECFYTQAKGTGQGVPLPLEIYHMILLIFLGVALFTLLVSTVLEGVLRFRRNLLKDEGYLMNTLPVTPLELIGSKLLGNVILMAIHLVITYLIIGVARLDLGWIRYFGDILHEGMADGTLRSFIIVMGIYMIVTYFLFMSQFYVSLSFGYRSSANRDLMSVVAYVATYLIIQAISVVTMILVYFKKYRSLAEMNSMSEAASISQVFELFIAMTVICVILTGVALAVTNMNIKKHLNLE